MLKKGSNYDTSDVMVIKKQPPWQVARKMYLRRMNIKESKAQKWDIEWIKRSPAMYGRVLFEECKISISHAFVRKSQNPAELLSAVFLTLKKQGLEKNMIEKIKDGIIKQAKGHGMILDRELRIVKTEKLYK